MYGLAGLCRNFWKALMDMEACENMVCEARIFVSLRPDRSSLRRWIASDRLDPLQSWYQYQIPRSSSRTIVRQTLRTSQRRFILVHSHLVVSMTAPHSHGRTGRPLSTNTQCMNATASSVLSILCSGARNRKPFGYHLAAWQ